MSKNRTQRKAGNLPIRILVSSVLGCGIMVILLLLGTWLILQGTMGESIMDDWLLASVFMGGVLSSVSCSGYKIAAIPLMLISSGGYIISLVLISFIGGDSSRISLLDWRIAFAALSGGAVGVVTNLVKSNKSYINKSKRKRKIT